jgi:hypothetical protein
LLGAWGLPDLVSSSPSGLCSQWSVKKWVVQSNWAAGTQEILTDRLRLGPFLQLVKELEVKQ